MKRAYGRRVGLLYIPTSQAKTCFSSLHQSLVSERQALYDMMRRVRATKDPEHVAYLNHRSVYVGFRFMPPKLRDKISPVW
jgi:hypothetical protein